MGGVSRSNWVFAALAAVALLLLIRILLPFLMPVLLGGFLVVLFQPLHHQLRQWLPHRPVLGAALATATVVTVLLLPIAIVAWLVGRELLGVAASAQVMLADGELHQQLASQLPKGLERLAGTLPRGEELEVALLGAVEWNATFLRSLLGGSTALVLHLFLMAVAAYYFFRDGTRLLAEFGRTVPLDPRHFRSFCAEFEQVAQAITYGNVLTGLAQGMVGFVGLWLAGVPHAVVWSLAMMLGAFIPVAGTGLVWGPIALALLLRGHTAEGLFLLSWGALLVGTVDNILRPKLCSARMTLHPLLVFLSIFGGVSVFGIMGILVGPLIASFFTSVVRIYRRDFLGLEPLPGAPVPTPDSPVRAGRQTGGQPIGVG